MSDLIQISFTKEEIINLHGWIVQVRMCRKLEQDKSNDGIPYLGKVELWENQRDSLKSIDTKLKEAH